ncbi:MAG: 5'-methylthioadenosine/adenosylhomocysteine nucleosidase [Bacillota bacterium]
MKIIGIIGAMDEEIALMKEKINITEEKEMTSCVFYVGTYAEKKIILVKSGIGKVNAAICAQVLVDHFGVDCIINAGVAGALDPALKLGDVVISLDAVQHDMDVSPLGDPIGIIPRMEESYFKAEPKLIAIAKELQKEITEYSLYFGRIASGDQFIATKEGTQRIIDTVQGTCAEMEGAAIAQACYLNHIPFLIIRAISDGADGEAAMSYEKFCVLAAGRSSYLLEKFLERM